MEPTKFGHYDLLELLGRGGMGEVWRAHDTATDRVVAVKVLLPHFADDNVYQQRFRREAHAAAALQDPHVVPIHNYGVIDGRLYVDMRFIEGRDLHSLIVDGDLTPTRTVHIIEQVAMALESAHSVGLIHRDIKPANVLVGKYDFAYLIDFGIAVQTGQTALTNTGLAIGTWAYMAPERFGTGQADARTDIYALACVLFECLTGRSPFPGADAQKVIVAHLTSAPPRVTAMRPELPPALDAVIARGMAKEPDARFQSAIELAEAAREAVLPRAAPASAPPQAARVAGPPPGAAPPGAPPLTPSRPPGPPPRPHQSAPTAQPRPPGPVQYPHGPAVGARTPPPRVPVAPPAPQPANPSVHLGTTALGLGVGTTNLVAMRDGRPAISRRSVLTCYADRAAEVGVPAENAQLNPSAGPPGVVLTSFVERVGDPVALVAADGSSHHGEAALVDALDAMARTVGGGAPVAVTVPSHWSPAAVEALRGALRGRPRLSPENAPTTIIPDAAAALACLSADPGLPTNGVILLCDIGGTGTNITLADAGAGLALIGETVRHREFSGDTIDQMVLNHVVDEIARERGGDPDGTAAVASLARLREDCRRAKERLSTETSAVVSAEMRGRSTEVRVTRFDLERLIDRPVHGLVDAVDDVLLRHRVPESSVSTIALVGGGAAIPLVAQRLSEQLNVPVVTKPMPQFVNATGAMIAAVRGPAAEPATSLNASLDEETSLASPVAWAGNAPLLTDVPATRKAPQEYSDVPVTRKAPEQVEALAWSQDDTPDNGDYTVLANEGYSSPSLDEATVDARPVLNFDNQQPQSYRPDGPAPEETPASRSKRTPMVFGAIAAAVLLTAGGIAAAVSLTGTSSTIESPPPETSAPSTTMKAPPPKPSAPSTTTPPPPPSTTAPPPAPVTTKAPPPYTPPRTTRPPATTQAPPPTTEVTPPPEVTTEPTEPTVPTFEPTLPTVPTLPPLFPEITLPPLFPQAPQP